MHISGINKAALKGSFVIAAFAKIDGKEHLIGRQSVLSRWAISGCANCQTHLEVKAAFSIQHLPAAIGKDNIYTKVLCRRQVNNTANITLSELKATAKKDAPLIKHNLEIR